MSGVAPAEVFPPGDYIKAEIEARGWTPADLSAALGCATQMVSDLLDGKRGITPDTASGLAAAFGTSAQVWMNIQAVYDSRNAG